jgi:hydroxymethylbilane synthase
VIGRTARPVLKLGTRGSDLALFQARAVASLLSARGAVECELVPITTSGERFTEAPLSTIGGKNVFVKEIEEALGAGHVDLAVHSSKDLPAVLPDGFAIGAVLPREDPRDAVVLPGDGTAVPFEDLVEHLGSAPRIGTGSVRRVAQLARLVPSARFLPIRGNLGTRLRKLDGGSFDAIVLAAAGLTRLGYKDRISALIPSDACVPAPGQGIIAVEVRADDDRVRTPVERIDDVDAAIALEAERAVVERLGGGCQMPIGAYATVDADGVTLTAVVISPDGTREVRATVRDTRARARDAGTAAAEVMLSRGAGEILAAIDGVRGAEAPRS